MPSGSKNVVCVILPAFFNEPWLICHIKMCVVERVNFISIFVLGISCHQIYNYYDTLLTSRALSTWLGSVFYAGWKCCLSWSRQIIIRARGRLFRKAPTRARDSFPNAPTRARDSFPNVPTRARDSFSQCSKSSLQLAFELPVRSVCIWLFLSQYAFYLSKYFLY